MTFLKTLLASPTSSIESQVSLSNILGSITYLNYDKHLDELKLLTQKYHYKTPTNNIILVISFRYAQVVDTESLIELSKLIEVLRTDRVRITLTGLHLKLMEKMERIDYFSMMLQEDEKCMYALHVGELDEIGG